jgi:Domain of unknown function (DUF3883)
LVDSAPRAGEAWTRPEVDLLVAEYVDMLRRELRGERVIKAERVRALQQILTVRTSPSIERKMQNVSAVLDERGYAWIDGYKPLPHYQRDLVDSVLAVVQGPRQVSEALERYADNAVAAPSREPLATTDVLVGRPSARERRPGTRPPIGLTGGVSGALRDFRNRALGRAGEEWVLDLEREKLDRGGRRDLADRVSWVAAVIGDGLGYDISSFELAGEPLKVEVKTTNLGPRTPFYITRNEVDVSRSEAAEYALYRVFDFHRDPRLFILKGSVEDNARLEPSVFLGYSL